MSSTDIEEAVVVGQAPAPELENALVPVNLAVALTRAEIDQAIATAHAFPRDIHAARNQMISIATLDAEMAEESVYAVPRGGKIIRGPSIRFAEIIFQSWGNLRCAARVSFEDRIERFVEAEAVVHDLQTNASWTARVRRRIQLKRGSRHIDSDMLQLAGSAAMSVARRNAILACVPKNVWRAAYQAVESVIRGDQRTMVERRDAAIAYFNKTGVDTARILRALDIATVDEITLDHLADLQGMRTSIKTGDATLDELFPAAPPAPSDKPRGTKETLEALATVDPETGEIKQASPETPAAAAPATPAGAVDLGRSAAPQMSDSVTAENAGVRPPPAVGSSEQDAGGGSPTPPAPASRKRKTTDQEGGLAMRVITKGDEMAKNGVMALKDWFNDLSGEEIAVITAEMEHRWLGIAQLKDS